LATPWSLAPTEYKARAVKRNVGTLDAVANPTVDRLALNITLFAAETGGDTLSTIDAVLFWSSKTVTVALPAWVDVRSDDPELALIEAKLKVPNVLAKLILPAPGADTEID
jgi:hypothetical protein